MHSSDAHPAPIYQIAASRQQLHCADRLSQTHSRSSQNPEQATSAKQALRPPFPLPNSARSPVPPHEIQRHAEIPSSPGTQNRKPAPDPRQPEGYGPTEEGASGSPPGRWWSEDEAVAPSRPSSSRGRRTAASSSYASRAADPTEAIPLYPKPARSPVRP